MTACPACAGAQEALNAELAALTARESQMHAEAAHLQARQSVLADLVRLILRAGPLARAERHGDLLLVTFDLGAGAPQPKGGDHG